MKHSAGQAAFLERRGLQVPALLLLDVASPFRVLIQQVLLVAHPLLSPWAGDRLLLWAGLFEDDEALEEARRRLGARAPKGPDEGTWS